MTDVITSETLAGAELVKRERKSREVPKVRVYAVHDPECRWAGESTRISCKCRKQLKYFKDGKRIVLAADIDKNKAEEQARELENELAAIARGEQPKTTTKGKTLVEAIQLFLDSKKDVTESYVNKQRRELAAFDTFCASQNLLALASIQTEHILQFRNSLVGAQNTRAKQVFRLIGFFSFCVEMGWIARNPAKVKAVKLNYSDEQIPRALTDQQFEDYLAYARQINGRTTDEQRAAFRSLIILMRWTGLSIRDAVCIERKRFEKNGDGFWQLFLRRAKTGHKVFCTITDETYTAIMAGAKSGRYLFVDSVPENERELNIMINRWGELFGKLADIADIKDAEGEALRPTSHWLRHTFVRWCLDHDLPSEDIAALIGDSVQVLVRHYSDWITARQERLSARMIAALTAQA